MINVRQPELDTEPTPEFNQRCLNVVHHWKSGELPFKEAIALLNGYVHEAVTYGHVANHGRAEHLLGYIQHYRGNLNTSTQHYERARTLYRRLNNRERVATMDLNMGENYRFKGDFTRALRLYRSAYSAAKDLGNVVIQTVAAVNEGLVLLTIKQNLSARRAFQTGLELAPQWTENFDKRTELLCEIYYGMAVIYLRENNPEAAWKQALLALETAHQSGLPLQLGYAHRTLGEVITQLQISPDPNFSSDPDEHFRAAITAFREINAEAELARTMYAQAMSLATRGRRTTAAKKLQQVMIIFTKLDMVDDAARAAEAQLAVL